MLEGIFGIGIVWYYVVGIILLVAGLLKLYLGAKNCMGSAWDFMEGKETSGKCISSIKQVGAMFLILVAYAIALVLVSVYVIVYGFQNGWGTVHTLDLAFAFGYLFLVAVILIK